MCKINQQPKKLWNTAFWRLVTGTYFVMQNSGVRGCTGGAGSTSNPRILQRRVCLNISILRQNILLTIKIVNSLEYQSFPRSVRSASNRRQRIPRTPPRQEGSVSASRLRRRQRTMSRARASERASARSPRRREKGGGGIKAILFLTTLAVRILK